MPRKRARSKPPANHFDLVGEIARQLAVLGLDSVLVGGMALVLLGSRRVTRDLDFVIGQRKGVLVLLHGFIKKTHRTPPVELALARKRVKELG